MKRLTCLFAFLLVFGVAQGVWAGAQQEVEDLTKQLLKAFNEGNIEALMSLFADDAQRFGARAPFRQDGKDAIRADYEAIFRAFPTRRLVPSQQSIRVYGDTVALNTWYLTLRGVDPEGKARTLLVRGSSTYVKIGGKWLIVTAHASLLPVSP